MDDSKGMALALAEAEKSYAEGGIPIGAALVAADGTVLGTGHNMRIQKGLATLHGETSALENAGRLPASAYKGATMYTTLLPCSMCTGACLLYGIERVVMGENQTFVGAEDWLHTKGVEVVNMENARCKELMAKFIEERPGDWNEDIGEE